MQFLVGSLAGAALFLFGVCVGWGFCKAVLSGEQRVFLERFEDRYEELRVESQRRSTALKRLEVQVQEEQKELIEILGHWVEAQPERGQS